MTAASTPVSLDEVLAYRHPGVVRRYMKEQGAAAEEAETVFRETLKWLYLCYRGALAGHVCALTPDLAQLDEMWHTFLLFSRDYADFCDRYFGVFLHHVPNEDEDDGGRPSDEAEVREQLGRQYGLVYDVLGEETLTAWHDECRFAAAA